MQRTSTINFVCPTCGGQTYGSSVAGDDLRGPRTYHCHGFVKCPNPKVGVADGFFGYRSCTFTWTEAEAWKHFHRHIVESFQSKEEYDAAAFLRNLDTVAAVVPDDGSSNGQFAVTKVKPA